MAQRLSDAFGVSHEAFVGEGAFDAFVGIDSRFHVDPHLISSSSVPELADAYETFTSHFADIIRLLDASTAPGDRFYREAVKRLVFHELPGVALGYSRGSIAGSGIGVGLAKNIAATAAEIVAAGIRDPAIFELIGLLEEGIGADRVSDMTLSIIRPHVFNFSERVTRNLGLRARTYTWRGKSISLPFLPERGTVTLLVPADVLRKLPVALDWDDVDLVSTYNDALRGRVNQAIGQTWITTGRQLSKRKLRDALLGSPTVLKSLINDYKKRPADAYDFTSDPAGELIWHDIAQEFSERFPLKLRKPSVDADNILNVVIKLCDHFGNLVEANGLFHVFYDDERNLRNERFAQLLFYGIADAYCAANGLDLSREPNAGRGPVDFKVSRGYDARVNVEVKYSSNKRLASGYANQLPIYDKAERTQHSIYLIIRTTDSVAGIEAVQEAERDQLNQGKRAPKIIVIDGRYKRPASKA
jgi:hypothetical protein